MTDPFETILDECISALQAGVPLEEILAEVPDFAAELRPMLYAATLLTNPAPIPIPEERKQALRGKYLQEVTTLPPSPTWWAKGQAAYHIMRRRWTREAILSDLVTVTVTIILTLFMSSLMLNYAANEALPGDLLYNFKRLSENIQLTTALSTPRALSLQQQFNQRRLAEIEELFKLNRPAVVEFTGVIEGQVDNVWIVEGFTLILPSDLPMDSPPTEGQQVHVVAFVRANQTLVADRIKVVP